MTTPDRAATNGAYPVPSWMGWLAGVSAAAVALGFGQFIEGVTDVPGLVLGVGELVIDYMPGWAAEESIENLGSAGKGNLLRGITIVSFVIAAVLGDRSARRSRAVGIWGFVAFGLLGGWATARNPQSGVVASWLWALTAAVLVSCAVALLFFGVLPGTVLETTRSFFIDVVGFAAGG